MVKLVLLVQMQAHCTVDVAAEGIAANTVYALHHDMPRPQPLIVQSILRHLLALPSPHPARAAGSAFSSQSPAILAAAAYSAFLQLLHLPSWQPSRP